MPKYPQLACIQTLVAILNEEISNHIDFSFRSAIS